MIKNILKNKKGFTLVELLIIIGIIAILFAVVGAGLGALVGLVADFLGAGHWAIVACGLAGAASPVFFGAPGK